MGVMAWVVGAGKWAEMGVTDTHHPFHNSGTFCSLLLGLSNMCTEIVAYCALHHQKGHLFSSSSCLYKQTTEEEWEDGAFIILFLCWESVNQNALICRTSDMRTYWSVLSFSGMDAFLQFWKAPLVSWVFVPYWQMKKLKRIINVCGWI